MNYFKIDVLSFLANFPARCYLPILTLEIISKDFTINHMVRHPRCVFIDYNWINELSNTTIWWLDMCCLLHRYQLHVSGLSKLYKLRQAQ